MKLPFVDSKLYLQFVHNPKIQEKNLQDLKPRVKRKHDIKTASRSSTVINPFVGGIILLYSGKKYIKLTIKPEMVGLKLGCFVFTKHLGKSIHESLRNKKKEEKRKRKITMKKIRKTVVKKKKNKTKKKK